MKIFFYINVLHGGGAERVVANLANQFADHGDDVSVITSYALETEYHVSDRVRRVNLESAEKNYGFFRRNIYRVTALRRILKKEKPDILISFMAEPNYRAVLAAMGLKTKTLISVRNDPNKEYSGRIASWLARTLLVKADGCVFQTEDARKWFPESLQQKSCVIANAVNPIFFDVDRSPISGLVVTCGRLNEQKNHDLLIRSFFEVTKQNPHVRLHIYGEGVLKAELQKKIDACNLNEKVVLCGSTNQVADVLSKASIFVMSSDYEGMPNALMEAMASGVPCISTDCPCGGPRMLIDDKIDGLLVPVGDADALINAMLNLINDPENAEKIGVKAKNKALGFSPDTIFDEWKKYVYSVIYNDEEPSI